ncbi:phosphatase PAP2 family protein [Emydomyces testavorans]|uniref:Phosphatase PAP2 family protein n=1 Tax=Emydomyces testavorans TaxID=2070801 RepID=A0AAF0DL60_9EURO|nr:phosphatase PAP2 family protein [Emydomyces testavorans]
MFLALAITFGGPLVVIVVYTIVIDGLFSHRKPTNPTTGRRSFMGKYKLKDRLWELNCGVLGLLLSQGAAFVITSALKNAAGKPRPDIIDRCRPRPGSEDAPVFGLSNSSICTQTDHAILKDGFRSFPSAAFAGLFYLSLYLAGKLHVLDSRGEVWKTFVIMVPIVGAALVAISRIMDARHHPFDVISGSLLGILCAWMSYRQYFPPISEAWKKGRAYPIRTWGTIPQPPEFGERRRFDLEDDDETKPMAPRDVEYEGASPAGPPMHSALQETEHLTSSEDPFQPPQSYARRRRDDANPNYSSSSGGSHVAYEMQSGYKGRHQANDSQEHLASSRPVDMAYHPPSQQRP